MKDNPWPITLHNRNFRGPDIEVCHPGCSYSLILKLYTPLPLSLLMANLNEVSYLELNYTCHVIAKIRRLQVKY